MRETTAEKFEKNRPVDVKKYDVLFALGYTFL